MSFVKSPRVVRSGVNASQAPLISPRTSARIAQLASSETDQSLSVSPRSSPRSKPSTTARQVPLWGALMMLGALSVHLAAYVLGYMEFEIFVKRPAVRHLLSEDAAHLGWALAVAPLGMITISIEIFGLAFFVGAGIFCVYKFELGRGVGAWLILFAAALLYNINLQVFRKWAVGNTVVSAEDEHFDVNQGSQNMHWWIYAVCGTLTAGVAAVAATRTRVWSHWDSHAAVIGLKVGVALGTLGFGIAPIVGVFTKTPEVGFYASVGSAGILLIVILATMIANTMREKALAASAAEKQALLTTVDHTTETI